MFFANCRPPRNKRRASSSVRPELLPLSDCVGVLLAAGAGVLAAGAGVLGAGVDALPEEPLDEPLEEEPLLLPEDAAALEVEVG